MHEHERARPAAREELPALPPRSPPETGTAVLVLRGPIARADIPALCAGAHELLRRCRSDRVVCDVAALTAPDLATIDALARLRLTALRSGRQLRLRNACHDLRGLLALTGLLGVLPLAALPLEPGRQAEQREQPLGVEEEDDPGDPVA